MTMVYRSSKTYGHDVGLSCCFRQWRAESHCSLLHGYALAVHLEFEASELDANGWVIDFGGLREVKSVLVDQFDHKLLVAADDPNLDDIMMLGALGVADPLLVHRTGCEAFARLVFVAVDCWLHANDYAPRVALHHVDIREHGANAASYYAPQVAS